MQVPGESSITSLGRQYGMSRKERLLIIVIKDQLDEVRRQVGCLWLGDVTERVSLVLRHKESPGSLSGILPWVFHQVM